LKESKIKVDGKTSGISANYIRDSWLGEKRDLNEVCDLIEEQNFYNQRNLEEKYKTQYNREWILKHNIKCSWDDGSCQKYLKGTDTSSLVSFGEEIRDRIKDEIVIEWFRTSDLSPDFLPRLVRDRSVRLISERKIDY
jgi:hypothetical protein